MYGYKSWPPIDKDCTQYNCSWIIASPYRQDDYHNERFLNTCIAYNACLWVVGVNDLFDFYGSSALSLMWLAKNSPAGGNGFYASGTPPYPNHTTCYRPYDCINEPLSRSYSTHWWNWNWNCQPHLNCINGSRLNGRRWFLGLMISISIVVHLLGLTGIIIDLYKRSDIDRQNFHHYHSESNNNNPSNTVDD